MAIHPQCAVDLNLTLTVFFKGGTPSLIDIFRKDNTGSFKSSIGLLYLKLGLANNPKQKHVFIKTGVSKILGIL
jgi:hypothetical protein